MAVAPTQATPTSSNTATAAAAAPVGSTPVNPVAPPTGTNSSAPRTSIPGGPGVTNAGPQPTRPAAAASNQLTGGFSKAALNNLSQVSGFKRLQAILGDTTAEVADKIATTAKKLWNSFVENSVGPVKNLNEVIRRTIRFWTKPAMVVIRPVAKLVDNRFSRVIKRYNKLKNGSLTGKQAPGVSAPAAGSGTTNANSASAPPQRTSAPASTQKLPPRGLASRAFAKVASVASAATGLRDVLGIPHLPGAGANTAKTQRTARPTI